MGVSDLDPDAHGRRPWNSGNMVGAKRPLKPRDVWAIRFFLDEHRRLRDRALFDLAIDSKLRGCDIVKMKIGDIVAGGTLRTRATVIQPKTNPARAIRADDRGAQDIADMAQPSRWLARRLHLPKPHQLYGSPQHPPVCPIGR